MPPGWVEEAVEIHDRGAHRVRAVRVLVGPAALPGRVRPIDDQEAGQRDPDGQEYLHVSGTPRGRTEFHDQGPEEPGKIPTELAKRFRARLIERVFSVPACPNSSVGRASPW